MRRTPWIRCAVSLPLLVAWTVGSAQGGRGVSSGAGHIAEPATAKYLQAGAVSSDVLAINPFACEGWDALDGDALRAIDVQRYCVGLDCLLEAPVELPSGTVVTRLELDAFDAGPASVKASFLRCAVGEEACTLLAEVITSGSPASTQVGSDLPAPETIDNRDVTYLIQVVLGDDDLTRLVGLRLLFTGPESPVQSKILAIHPHAHEGWSAIDRSGLRSMGVQRYCDGAACTLIAPVELPSGATVTRIELDAYDNSPSNVEASFGRCLQVSGVCTPLATVSTSGMPGATQPGIDLGSPEIIDNANYTYISSVSLGATNTTRLVGVRLHIDVPVGLPRTDWLALSPFAHEGMEAGDIDALDASGGERHCVGQSCVAIAPVELPSGTVVTRLELDAFDDGLAEDVESVFLRCPLGGAMCTGLATVKTSGAPGATHEGVALLVAEKIDNEASTYQVRVQLGAGDTYRLRSIRLAIEHSRIFNDGFGTGDTSSWSRAVP